MAKFKDFSGYKNNTLKYYFFQKALKDYALEKEKQDIDKPKIGDNLLFSTLFTFLVSETNFFLSFKHKGLILYLLITILFYGIMMGFYFLCVFPMYKYLKNKFEDWKFNRVTNPDNLRSPEEKTHQAYLNRFNHEISDQIAIAIDITSRVKENPDAKVENHFYVSEAFESLQSATVQLFILLGSKDFSQKQGSDFKIIKKHKISELVPLIDKVTLKINNYWKDYGCLKEHEAELENHRECVKFIQQILDASPRTT